jgi:DNA-binding SARP family transcriptional activator
LYHIKGDYERAGALLEEALHCAKQSGYIYVEALALSSIGDLYADLNAPGAALNAYHQAREIARQIDYGYLLLHLDITEAVLARSRNDLDQARDLLGSARCLARESGSKYEGGLCQLEAGRLSLANGDASEAIVFLEEAADLFDSDEQRVESACTYLYLAIACQIAGDEKAALAHLERTFHRASSLESQHILVIAGRDATTLLETAKDSPIIGREASQLLGQIAWFERDVPRLRRRLRGKTATVPFAPPRLTIQALGRAQTRLDGRPVTAPEWQSRQIVRDLFFLLLAHPEGLTKEAVGIIFWADKSPSQLKLQFKNTIYRLRRALGQDVILFNEGRYQFNRTLDYEYDVETFLGKLAQAQEAADPDEQAAAYREAIDLYTGSYLPEMEGTWVFPERERLWQAYSEAILNLAEFYLETGEYRMTLEYCRRILVQDPTLEMGHRLAMRAHAATGNRTAIVRQFERCQQALLEEVNALPSPQTETLYQTLMR